MVTLKMQKQCGCFRKSSYEEIQEFDTKEEALTRAKDMCDDMNENFCQKHNFYLQEDESEILIIMEIAK